MSLDLKTALCDRVIDIIESSYPKKDIKELLIDDDDAKE